VFSVATVDLAVPQARDLDRAIEAVVRVGREMRADPAWSDRFLPDSETDVTVISVGLDGATPMPVTNAGGWPIP
jgi:hypothetical protein